MPEGLPLLMDRAYEGNEPTRVMVADGDHKKGSIACESVLLVLENRTPEKLNPPPIEPCCKPVVQPSESCLRRRLFLTS